MIFFASKLMSNNTFSCDKPNNLDPYEQKLFLLFSSHENGSGIIDLSGLNNLTQTLQLKEKGSVLISLLLKNGTKSGVTFKEFREGLLQVITNEDDGMLLKTPLYCVQWIWHSGGGLDSHYTVYSFELRCYLLSH
jgi:hypothetical protein